MFAPCRSVGPFAAIVATYGTVNTVDDAEVSIRIVVLGCAVIVVGLATLDCKVMQAIAVSLTRITSSRGFAIELDAAVVAIGASRVGIPVPYRPHIVRYETEFWCLPHACPSFYRQCFRACILR